MSKRIAKHNASYAYQLPKPVLLPHVGMQFVLCGQTFNVTRFHYYGLRIDVEAVAAIAADRDDYRDTWKPTLRPTVGTMVEVRKEKR